METVHRTTKSKILNFYNHKVHRTVGVSPEETSDSFSRTSFSLHEASATVNPEIINENISENNENIMKSKNFNLEIMLEF